VLEFKTRIEIDVDEDNPFDFILESHATAYPFSYREPDLSSLKSYLDSKAGAGAFRSLDWFYSVVPSPSAHSDVVQFLADLNTAIRREIRYVRRDEEGIQEPDTTIQLQSGSCRDMAVLFIAILRQLGLAVRFCSGYLYVPPVEEGGVPGENRADGSMHAWAEVYLPGAGWKGFDPTNGVLANSFYIPCGVSHEPLNVNPIQGSYYCKTSVASTMEVDLQMEAIT
jgi:transglutaminase-like putative cysteine protease